MRLHLWALLSILITGCDVEEPDGSGIAVGNPPGTGDPSARVTVADGIQVLVEAFELPLAGVYLENEDGFGRLYELEDTVLDLSERTTVSLPEGDWRAVGLVPDRQQPARLSGTAGPGRFRFEGRLGRILLYSERLAELRRGDELVLELAEPGWLLAEDFGVGAGEERFVGDPDCVDDALCTRIRSGLMNRAGLYRDLDRNGRVDEPERDEGPRAAGDSRRERQSQ